MGKVTDSTFPASLAVLRLGIHASYDDATAARELKPNPLRGVARAVYPYALFLALPVLALLLFVRPPFLLVGYVGVPLLFLLRWLALSSPLPAARVNPIVLVFMLSLIGGMMRAENTASTVVPVARLVAGITVMYLVLDYAERPGRLWNVAAGLVLVGLVLALVAPFVTEPPPDKLIDASWLFRPGPLRTEESNPNVVAAALAVVIPLALALLTDPEKRFRVLGAISLPPLLIMLTLLQARSMWVATMLGIVLFGALFRRWVLTLFTVAVVTVLAYGALAPQLELPVELPILPLEPARVLDLLQGRQQVWDFAASLLVREPLGIGIGAYSNYANNLASDWLTAPQREHAHNLMLQAGLDVGFIGLGAFAALFAYAFYASWRAIRREIKKNLASGVFVALFVAFLGGMFEVNMWGNKATVLLWALFGMAFVLGRFGARARERTPRRHHHKETVPAE